MKKLALIFYFFLACFSIKAQSFGNEWINYSQKYYSFSLSQTGLYKIDVASLAAAGIPINTFTAGNVQLFGREKELPLFIQDGGDNLLDIGDLIFFYAEKNDGWLDSTLYDDPSRMGNPKYSLYNDTIQYFFTWNSSENNKRFVLENDVDFNSYSPSNYVLAEKWQSFSQSYIAGEKSSDASSSFFVSGEGWGSAAQNGVNGFTWNLSSTLLENVYQGLDAPLVNYRAVTVGASNAVFGGIGNHHSLHTIGSSNYVLLDTIFTGYQGISINKQFPVSVLPAAGGTNYKVSIIGDQGALSDFQSLNYWSFLYPRLPSFLNANKTTFLIENNSNQAKIRLNMSSLSLTNPYCFVLGDVPRKVPVVTVSSGNFQVLIPNSASGAKQQVVLQDVSTIFNINTLKLVNGTGFFTDFSSLPNLEKALLFIYHPKIENSVIEYATYRSSILGGDYNVILSKTDELYQQFGGGIPKHINGIRRYAHYIYSLSNEKPVGMYLLGKGIREANVTTALSSGPGTRLSPATYSQSLVPSFGQPSCDVCITSNLGGMDKWAPLIPTGRISANTNIELQTYLSKVKEFELQQDPGSIYSSQSKDWQKQILHFSGGNNSNEQYLFQLYLNNMAAIAEDDYFGGNTTLVAKQSGNPLTPAQVQGIQDRIKEGVTIMNFFGHSSSSISGFDVNLDEPENWDNQGRYPLLIANSCYNGNIFQSTTTKSEQFVLTPNAGVIAYLGTIDYGFTSALNDFSNNFYKQFSLYNYGGTLGSHIKNLIDTVMNPNSDLITESTFSQMTLHGDPMLRLNSHDKPEIELTDPRIVFGPDNITLATDSIDISVTLKNLGKSIPGDFTLQILRDFPGSLVDSNYVFIVNGLDYEKTIQVKIPFYPLIGVGLNRFTIIADIPSVVDEQYDEVTNNQVLKNFIINIDGIEPILPIDFAVVPRDTIALFASTIDPLAPLNTYRFEIDTVHTFNSGFRRYAMVTGLGGVKSVNWNQWISNSTNMSSPLVMIDSVVYYWRVSLNEAMPVWKTRSFQYIINKEGWGQDDFHQFTLNTPIGINLNQINENREFVPIQKTISCLALASYSIPFIYDNAWYLNDEQQEYEVCNLSPKFHVAVIDKATLLPWETRYTYPNGAVVNPNNNFGNANDNSGCKPRPMRYFTFQQNNAAQIDAFQNLVENVVQNGDYILIYSPMTTRYDWWDLYDPGLYQTFSNLGSDSIYAGRPNRPFIFLTRKGDPSFVVELVSQNNENIFLDTLISGSQLFGLETTPLIGPVSEWKSLFWKRDGLEQTAGDSTILNIKLFNVYGAYQYTIDTLMTPNDSIIQLSNLIDPVLFPYMRLEAQYYDSITQTPSQLDFWHVVFAPLPEAAIDASNGITWTTLNDTLQEGETVEFAVDVRNISDYGMDSLLVNYYIVDKNEVIHPILYPRQGPLLSGGIFRDTIEFSSIGLVGENWLRMEINPYVDLLNAQTDQPELTHINNLLQFPFAVQSEDINPILDVTFNGQHILNNDIIAPTTEIIVTLKDENPYLVMSEDADTSLFGIYLTDPEGEQFKIPFMNSNGEVIMQWIPAEMQNKKFKIIYPKYFEKTGIYSLLVQGSDKSGNLSGDFEYKINFEVIHESAITEFLNYPNPFSTSTRFVFTVTGDDLPDDILIQVMNINGKVVREITEGELGPIHVGRNITDFAWDGKDQFGDQLANGIYLYRVQARLNGQNVKQLESGADKFIHKGLGKMYLIR
jgi:hypothetical protein